MRGQCTPPSNHCARQKGSKSFRKGPQAKWRSDTLAAPPYLAAFPTNNNELNMDTSKHCSNNEDAARWGASLDGTVSADLTNLRFNRPCRASPTGLELQKVQPTRTTASRLPALL
eukprot:6186572-Pleurochrysis_carterae.AAC.1